MKAWLTPTVAVVTCTLLAAGVSACSSSAPDVTDVSVPDVLTSLGAFPTTTSPGQPGVDGDGEVEVDMDVDDAGEVSDARVAVTMVAQVLASDVTATAAQQGVPVTFASLQQAVDSAGYGSADVSVTVDRDVERVVVASLVDPDVRSCIVVLDGQADMQGC